MINESSKTLLCLSDKYPQLHDWIHVTYAKPSGIFKDEYRIYSDDNLQHAGSSVDIIWQAGTVIHICVRVHPIDNIEAFKQAMQHAFDDRMLLRSLLRLQKGLEADKRFNVPQSIASTFIGLEPPERKEKERRFSKRIHTIVVIKDRKSGREQHMEVINSDAFTTLAMAYKLLYGEEI